MIVGIGAAVADERVIASISRVADRVAVRCYTADTRFPSLSGYEVSVSKRPWEALVSDLVEGRIDAAVRGSLPASDTLGELKRALGVDHLERIALLETPAGVQFLLAPVGVDEGWTVVDKLAFIEKSRFIAEKFGINPRVAVLSGGRLGDVGRHKEVDRSLAEAELVARLAGADHAEILIEEALKDHGIIIAPDGIAGNLIFRTLTLVGGGRGHGAPVVNISKIFVDTSRATVNYSNAILLAASLFKD
jgi:putative methanogen marker protein 4